MNSARSARRLPAIARSAAGLLCLVAPLLLTGCGYEPNGVFRKGIETVYVDMFETKEFRRNLEFSLTEAVKKHIAAETPYRLAPKDRADTILRGEILEERQAAFAPDFRSRIPREINLTVACRLEWKDLRSGEVLLSRPVLLQSADYIEALGETERYGQTVAIDKLASRIVQQMYDQW
jgi:hypothetical protein